MNAMPKVYALKPWNQVAVPHDDILGGDFDLSSYAANLGSVDAAMAGTPEVYLDAPTFFRATYMTSALSELLRDVANVLTGAAGNRLVQLRTPFGGGKTHTLIALLHLVRHRKALQDAGLLEDMPDPGSKARVVVLPCLDLNAADGRQVDGLHLRTLWGELAYRAGGKAAYELVRKADEHRVNPGSEVIRKVLSGQPTLVLMDEVLTYVEGALGVPVGDSNLGRQTMVFLQHLTEAVRGLEKGAMVYSLQQSVREAVGDEGLLDQLDALTSRLDAKKEPVTGDEVLQVVQRRLFKELGPTEVREAVADEYATLLHDFLSQEAQTEGDKHRARDEADRLRERVLNSYPFHPELLDLMYHRWGSLPSYQRTRGALQFLATVIGALWQRGDAGALIGPGDVPLEEGMVRNTFFSQVGEREALKSVLDSDLLGAGARCKRVDAAIADRAPAYGPKLPGTRLTRAIALYSFGAKPGEDRGVLRTDLLAATQIPGLQADVLDGALQGLLDTLLYIHATGRRFRFEKRPNLNKLIDDEVRKVDPDEVSQEIQSALVGVMGSRSGFVLWPKVSDDVKDRQPRFQVVFMDHKHALMPREEQEDVVKQWLDNVGRNKRVYRNALGFAMPDPGAFDKARSAARKVRGIAALLEDTRQRFDREDKQDLTHRRERAKTDLQAATRQIYRTILLPILPPAGSQTSMTIQPVEIPPHQLAGGSLLESIYQALSNWLFATALPKKLISVLKLGSGEVGTRGHFVSGQELVDSVFGSLHFPRLMTLDGLKKSIAEGVTNGAFGYVMGAEEDAGTLKLLTLDSLTWKRPVEASDIDLSAGAYLVSKAFAEKLVQQPTGSGDGQTGDQEGDTDGGEEGPTDQGGGFQPPQPPPAAEPRGVRITLHLENGPELFKSFRILQALQSIADDVFETKIEVTARSNGYIDLNRLETSVIMALDEEEIDYDHTMLS